MDTIVKFLPLPAVLAVKQQRAGHTWFLFTMATELFAPIFNAGAAALVKIFTLK